MTSLAHRLAFETAILEGQSTYRDPDGLRRAVPDRAYIDRGIKPAWMTEESFRRRVESRLARQPSLEAVLEKFKRERNPSDRNSPRANSVVGFGPGAIEGEPQDTIPLVERDGISIEVSRFRGKLIVFSQPFASLYGFAMPALRELFLRLIRPLFHHFCSVGCLDNSNEDRSPAGLQGPIGERPQVRP